MQFDVIPIDKNNILSFEPYWPKEQLNAILQNGVGGLGLLTKEGASCGALMYHVNESENSVFADSICVDKSIRNNGGGRLLLNELEKNVPFLSGTLVARILPENNAGSISNFFTKCGFSDFNDGEWFFTIDKDMIHSFRKSEMGDRFKKRAKKKGIKITDLSRIPKNLVTAKNSGIPYDETASFTMDDALENGYSLGAWINDRDILINKFIINEDNTKNASAIFYAILKCYEAILPDDGSLRINAPADVHKSFWETMFPEASYVYTVYASKEFKNQEDILIDRQALAFPRLNLIGRYLEDAGFTYSLHSEDGLVNIISLNREGDKRPVRISCEVENAEASMFDTEIYSVFRLSELDDDEMTLLNKLQEEAGPVSTSILPEKDSAILSMNIMGSEIPMEEELFLGLLSAFIVQLDTLVQPEKMPEVSFENTVFAKE